MSTDCPLCGASGRIANLALLSLYQCTNRKCRAEYFVQHKGCRLCNEPIKDEYEYCDFHAAYYGEERPAVDHKKYCAICLETATEDSEYCNHHRDQFDQEHQDYLRRFEEERRTQEGNT